MKSLKSRLKKHEAVIGGSALNPDWSKYDDRLMKAAERGDVEKVSSILAKKGVSPTKLDVEGRSAFHVVASKGNLDCLNTILVHGVDITATDAAGRNALHLAAKYGHALCLQKLLQYNCPTENVDLQGRTALHDAAMSDCSASIQLLCDHGAAVNSKDGDGRTPLVLATQMCRPALCQLLIDRGADVNARDKQGRTALMLGCEYGCRDAVEVLLRNAADAALTDGLGHDSAYYARIGDNIDILASVKAALEDPSRGRGSVRRGQAEQKVPSGCQQWGRATAAQEELPPLQKEPSTQDLELENQDLRARMREVQEEQRMLLDRISGLQLQLSEKDELKKTLTTKEKQQEESLRTIEALKAKLKYYEGDSAGSGGNFANRKEDLLLKQGQGFAVESQSRSMLRPLELSLPAQSPSSEKESLKQELESLRSCLGAAKEEISKLQRELSLKCSECRALASECQRSKAEADGQVRQLEDALRDVQKRMFESEGKVKQMQSHFLALKEHLASEGASGGSKVAEELKEQLQEMKSKYEGASAEVGKLRNQIKQNELLVAEFQRDEGRLLEENKKLQKELVKLEMEREKRGRDVTELEGQLRDTAAKLAQSVSTEQFENMRSLLASEVSEKARRLAEVQGEREKLQAELGLLQRECESQRAQLAQCVQPEEHQQMRSGFEQRKEELGKAIAELSRKNETLQKELERLQADNKVLKQQVQMLKTEIKSQNVPLKIHEELKKTNDLAVGDLTKKLFEMTKKYNESKAEAEKLLAEKNSLNENISHFQAVYLSPEQHRKEVEALKSNGMELEKQLAELQKKCEEEQAKVGELLAENSGLKETLRDQYVLASTHEEVKTVLNSTLQKTNGELSDLKGKIGEIKQEFLRVTEENGALKNKVKVLQNQLKTEYISLKDHETTVKTLNQSVQELQEKNAAVRAEQERGQDEILQLHAEIEAQKKELDTIQECIRSRCALQDREQGCELQELRAQLQQLQHSCRHSQEEAQRCREENEQLRSGVVSIQQDLQHNQVLAEQSHRLEQLCASRMEELNQQLRALLRKHGGQEGQEELAGPRQVLAGHVEALGEALGRTVEELQEALGREQEQHGKELLQIRELQQELAGLKESSVPLVEYTQLKEGLEGEISAVRCSLQQKEAESRASSQEVLRLQEQLGLSQQAVAELQSQQQAARAEYSSIKSALEAQVSSMAAQLASVSHRYEQACQEAEQARRSQLSLREEKEQLQLRSCSIEQEIRDQKERCDRSLTTILELQRRIQESAEQVEAKDNKITELLNDVERLKQALNGLSQLTYTTGIPSKRHSQQVELLQSQVKTLQQQLADAKQQHQEVISVYRTHLLSAVQGHMDEDVQAALLQIIQMRQGLVC
ncbi:uveal autoantigen with coiled-coil domains and ankyrin repeats isoform X2 [Oenanthe melanoleuca]|uniref:uveal autoantigen with coiled-coil domains and ankyrin repeats isoform X2 n=1 Tax=Oenanthe melanoleuca TaxID=2939378 RepID=UPI0024C19530|nr:uveal autoantigen with coiled-coil domains and ankyrin repeats isoform X2 [Oenanthe melanoleuca]